MRTFAEKLQELVEYCRLYDQKTFVFGARKTAMLTMRFLEKHGIVPGVVVNRAYLQEAKQNNPHHECIALEDLPQICGGGRENQYRNRLLRIPMGADIPVSTLCGTCLCI